MLEEAANHEPAKGAEPHAGFLALTPRELEVLQMIAAGLTNAEAALRMQVSVHAIKFHLAGVYRRLGVTNRTEAAVAYLRSPYGSLDSSPQSD